jgi:hypothetical protein
MFLDERTARFPCDGSVTIPDPGYRRHMLRAIRPTALGVGREFDA